jgi:hypothetical protein
MANCQSWLELSLQEKIEMVGKVTHLIQNSNVGFKAVLEIIQSAEAVGMFKEVKINPPANETNNY